MSIFHQMKTLPCERGKLLNRQFCGVSTEGEASFREERMMLFSLEREVLETVATQNAARKLANEPTCRLSPMGSDIATIGNFEFAMDPFEGRLVHESPDFTIEVEQDAFRSDVEEVLQSIHSHSAILKRIAPARITIGVEYPANNAIGVCSPSSGKIAFFRDSHGGLLLSGLAAATRNDEFPICVEQVLLHEVAHAFERNADVEAKLTVLADDLAQFAREGFPSNSKTGKSLSEYCARINGGYLPARLESWKRSVTTSPNASANMASEFWAELCAASVLGQKPPFSTAESPLASLETIRDFVRSEFPSVIAGPLMEKRHSGKSREVTKTLSGRSSADLRIEYIEDRFSPER